jgi:hypothetical protein
MVTKTVMNESFDIPVSFKGETLFFSSRLLQCGYTHKFVVDVYGQPVYFEPDEERNYRAIIETADINTNKELNFELLKAVAHAIEAIIK